MPTADLHGSTIQIDTGNGEKTTFELVRVGTLKEFATVKAALENEREQVAGLGKLNEEQGEKLRAIAEKLATADRAYATEKEVSAALRQETADAHTVMASDLGTAREERDASRTALADLKAELLTEGDRFKAIMDTLAEKIVGE